MKNLFYPLLLMFLLISCDKEKQKAIVTLEFEPTYNGVPFNLDNTFEDSQNRVISAELIKFYVSTIILVSDEGEELMLKDIALIDLTENKRTIELSVPKGNYQKLKLGIGVPDELNEADPSNYTESDHPLSITQNTYWGMNSMYRFFMIDGRYDIENDGTFDGIFSYHSGFSFSYRDLEFPVDLELKRKDEVSLTINIEVTGILEGPGGTLDIINESNYHGDPADQHLAEILSDNVAAAFSIK